MCRRFAAPCADVDPGGASTAQAQEKGRNPARLGPFLPFLLVAAIPFLVRPHCGIFLSSGPLGKAALSETEILRQWEDLAASNPATAYRALWRLFGRRTNRFLCCC
jgi:hypothetical protein